MTGGGCRGGVESMALSNCQFQKGETVTQRAQVGWMRDAPHCWWMKWKEDGGECKTRLCCFNFSGVFRVRAGVCAEPRRWGRLYSERASAAHPACKLCTRFIAAQHGCIVCAPVLYSSGSRDKRVVSLIP